MNNDLSVQVFQPVFKILPPPMLDLFDLDETFSSEKVRLAQLSNKCKFPDVTFHSPVDYLLDSNYYRLLETTRKLLISRLLSSHITNRWKQRLFTVKN